MNIKRCIILFICISFALVISVSAVNLEDFAWYDEFGSVQYDMDGYHFALAKEMISDAELEIDAYNYFIRDSNTGEYCGYDYTTFLNDYNSAIASIKPIEEDSVDPFPSNDEILNENSESAITNDMVSNILQDNEIYYMMQSEESMSHIYTIDDLRDNTASGVINETLYIDMKKIDKYERYGLWYKVSDVQLTKQDFLNCLLTIKLNEQTESMYIRDVYDDICLDDSETFYSTPFFLIIYQEQKFDSLVLSNGIYISAPEYIEYLGGIVPDSFTFYMEGFNFGGMLMTNTLKSLVTAIFGEYTPVYSTEIIRETVDNETVTTLIDVVAEGAAGVDWAWIGGLILFAIMLYCLFKLLGGILS